MAAAFKFIGNLRLHKMKFLAVIGFTLMFAFILFPFNDLGDLITAKIAEGTGNQLYVQFDGLGVNVIPAVRVRMDDVLIESGNLPPIKATGLAIAPWVIGALSGRQGVSVDAQGLFGGIVVADYRQGEKLKSGDREVNLAVDGQGLKLPAVTEFLRESGMLTISLTGIADLNTQLKLDPLFDNQPSGAVGLNIAGFSLPGQTLQMNMNGAMMPVQLPELKFGKTKVAAKIGGGQIDIQDFSFGSGAESLSGQAKGNVGLSFRREGQTVRPMITAYELNVDLMVKKEFLTANEKGGVGMALSFLNNYRKDTPQGWRYAFKVKGNPNSPMPEISAAQ
jgi:type II secretion system protein N